MVAVGLSRHARVLVLALALVVITGLLTALASPTATAAPDPGPRPEQAGGTAAGRSHRASSDATEERNKPDRFDRGGPPAKGVAADVGLRRPKLTAPDAAETMVSVDGAETPGKVKGFDQATSRELPDRGGPKRLVFENADGTVTARHFQGRQMYQTGDGGWHQIDSTLVDAADGGWRSQADSEPKRFAASANAREIAAVELESGESYGFGVSQAAASSGTVRGDSVTYREVRTDANLELQATPVGVKETIVLRSADAPTEWQFPLRLDGLTARLDEHGTVLLTNQSGDVAAVIPPGFMEDSNIDAHSGDGVRSDKVTYRLSGEPGSQVLHVSVDKAWIEAPGRKFPVRVDPTMQRDSNASTYVMYPYINDYSGESILKVGTPDGGDTKANAFLKFNSVTSDLDNFKILDAKLGLYNVWSYSCNARDVSVHPVAESWSTSAPKSWPGPSVHSEIGSKSFASGWTDACGPKWHLIDLGDLGDPGINRVQSWVRGGPNNGLRVSASTTDSLGWKKFASANSANAPYLDITYSKWWAEYTVPSSFVKNPTAAADGAMRVTVKNDGKYTWTPASGYKLSYRLWDRSNNKELLYPAVARTSMTKNVATGQSITLDATVKKLEPGDYRLRWDMLVEGEARFSTVGIPYSVAVNFTIPNQQPYVTSMSPLSGFHSAALQPTLKVAGKDPDNYPNTGLKYQFKVCDDAGANCSTSTPSTSTSWTVPAGKLRWSKTYLWSARVADGSGAWGSFSGGAALTPVVAQPAITSHLGGKAGGGVDPGVGNFTTSATDAAVVVVGPELSVERTYNSQEPRKDLVFGAGWATRWDARLAPDDDGSGNVMITYPDGRQARFGKNPDGSYGAPQGQQATLVAVTGGGWTLRSPGDVTYTFDVEGRLTRITDTVGRAQILTYTEGQLTKATDQASGRSLTFAWQNGHITSVTTGPDPALTWTYTHAGDQLRKVCDPEGGCTGYTYQAGSVYRTAVMDANPTGYWRLAEAVTGTVGSEVPNVNDNLDGTAVATGEDLDGSPISQSTLPTAQFDGTSSYIKLTDNPLKDDKYMSVELWFKTSSNAGGVLFSTGNFTPGGTVGSSGSMPVLYVGTNGKLYGHFSNGNVTGIVTPTAVNDGAWHHVVLSAALDTQTLYLDGAKVGSQAGGVSAYHTHAYFGAGVVTTQPWPARPSAQWGYLNGSIAEASVYRRPLGATTAGEHHTARLATDQLTTITRPGGAVNDRVDYNTATERVTEHTDTNGAVWKYGSPTTVQSTGDGDETIWRTKIAVTDPIQEQTVYAFDPARAGRLVEVVDSDDRGGGKRTYAYDSGGFLNTVTDPNGHSIDLRHDARGNLISKTVPYWDDIEHTEYWSYYLNTADPLDPRNDQVTDHRNARSSSATDGTYRTRYTLNGDGQITKIEAPGATDGLQRVTANTYTTGSEAAVGGGTMPPGLLRTATDPEGGSTTYAYTSAGDIARTTDAVQSKHENGYDGIGRLTSEAVELADGTMATTITSYDMASRVTEIRKPVVTNAVTGAEQQRRTVHTYNPDGALAATTESDAKLAGSDRITTYEYDSLGRRNKTTDPEGGIEQLEYNNLGLVWKRTDPAGTAFTYSYVPTHTGWQLAETTVRGWTGDGADPHDVVLESRAYDPAGRLARVTDAMGNTTTQTYWHNNRPASTRLLNYLDPDTGTTTALRLMHRGFTGTGKVFGEVRTEGQENRTDYTYDPGDRVSKSVDKDNGVILRTTETAYDDLDNPADVRQLNADGTLASHVEYAYDAVGLETQRTQHVTSTKMAVTTTVRDTRGLPTEVIDPRGNATGANPADYTTSNTYDALGQLTTVKAPPVQVESNGGTTQTERPTTTTGYNAFGEGTHSRDPNGNVTRIAHDRAGRAVSQTQPSYAAPGTSTSIVATSEREFDNAGRLTAELDADGNRTTYGYDELGNLRLQVDPSLSIGNPGGTTQITYTPTGLPRATTDPTGAKTDTTYDQLGRALTSTVIERKPTPRNLTTELRYDRLGNVSKQISPSGLVTQTDYDGLGNPTKLTDPAGVATTAKYDSNGKVLRITHPDTAIRYFGYDYAGQNTSRWDESATGSLLREWHYGYDLAGNQTGAANTAGQYTDNTYDATNRLTKIRRLKSGDTDWITTSYGYDPAGNITRATDGNGHKTVFTVNSWNLPEATIEPATEQHPAAADRTYTVAYNKLSKVAGLRKPGDVSVTSTYNAVGDLTKQVGTGADVSTSDRSFDYDLAGRMTVASAPGGNNTYTYDDRANLLSAAGPSGDTELAWNDDGQLRSATTGAGTAQFTYDTGGRLATAADPITDVTLTYSYDTAGRVKSVGPAGGAIRTYGYDTFGRLSTDTLAKPDNSTSAKITYGYNQADELTAKTTTGIAGAGSNSYTYDKAGRLASWNNGTSAVDYTWDDNGNLTQKGGVSQTFNARNQLLSSGTNSYTYTPRGTRDAATGGETTTFEFNAFDELIAADDASYSYDALNRLTTAAGGGAIAYVGTSRDVASADGWSYSYNPIGEQIGAGNGTASGLAWGDQHTDLIGVYHPATGAVEGSRSYGPFGSITDSGGAEPSVGYQHQYTDPATGSVNMGSRWYAPETGTFSSRDTIGLDPRDNANANRYTYVAGSPLNHTDPHGTCLPPVAVFCGIAIGEGAAWLGAGLVAAGVGAAAGVGDWVSDIWDDLTIQRVPGVAVGPAPRFRWGFEGIDWAKLSTMGRAVGASLAGAAAADLWDWLRAIRGGGGSTRPPTSCGVACDGLARYLEREAARAGGALLTGQAYWQAVVEDRANTKAPRPKTGMTVLKAVKSLWDAVNDPNNDINLGILEPDENEEDSRYQPDNVPGGVSAPGQTKDEESIQIFRNVDEAEFNDISDTMRFNLGPGAMEGKWFALNGADADRWGRFLNKGRGITVETRIPRSTFDTLRYERMWDGIGPAAWANPPQLELINETMDGIRVWP